MARTSPPHCAPNSLRSHRCSASWTSRGARHAVRSAGRIARACAVGATPVPDTVATPRPWTRCASAAPSVARPCAAACATPVTGVGVRSAPRTGRAPRAARSSCWSARACAMPATCVRAPRPCPSRACASASSRPAGCAIPVTKRNGTGSAPRPRGKKKRCAVLRGWGYCKLWIISGCLLTFHPK